MIKIVTKAGLKKLILSKKLNNNTLDKYDYSLLTDMSYLMSDERGIEDFPSLDMKYVINSEKMFNNCENLKNVNLKNTENIENRKYMYSDCKSMESIEMDMKSVKNSDGVFNNCKKLKIINLRNTNNIGSRKHMYYNCKSLEFIEMDIECVINSNRMFFNCEKIKNVNLKNSGNIENCARMFFECDSLKNIQIKLSKIENLGKIGNMLCDCDSLRNLEINLGKNKFTKSGIIKKMLNVEDLKKIPEKLKITFKNNIDLKYFNIIAKDDLSIKKEKNIDNTTKKVVYNNIAMDLNI